MSATKSTSSTVTPFSAEAALVVLVQLLDEFALLLRPVGIAKILWTSSGRLNQLPRPANRRNSLATLLDPDLQAPLFATLNEIARGNQVREFVVPVQKETGEEWFSICLAPAAPSPNQCDVACLVSRNITARKLDQDHMRRNEALLAQAEEIASVGSWEFDLATRRCVLSKQLLRLFAIRPDEPLREQQYWSMIHPADRENAHRVSETAIEEGKPYEYIARCRLLDGRIRTHITRGFPVLGPDAKAQRVVGIIQDVTEQASREQALRVLSHRLISARDEERRQTARELHESAGQTIAALKMTMRRLRESLPLRADRARALLDTSVELADTAVREIRTVSYLMHPPMLDESGLDSALRWYAKGFSERSGIEVHLNLPEAQDRYPQEIETTVFRIVQESLTNMHRYSGTPSAHISLVHEGDVLSLEIADHGCGISALNNGGDGQTPAGVGIAGMRERVAGLNGIFQIESAPGRGTTIRAVLPLQEERQPTSKAAGAAKSPCLQSLIAS